MQAKTVLITGTIICPSCSGTGICHTCEGKHTIGREQWIWANPDALYAPESHYLCSPMGRPLCGSCKAMPKGEDPEEFYIKKCPIWLYLPSD